MRAGQGRCTLLCGLICAFIATASGCTVSGKSFSMDSNSRIPFFGLELKDRKPKVNAPSFNSISRADADNPRIESALQVRSSAPLSLMKSANRRQPAISVSGDGYERASGRLEQVADAKPELMRAIPIPVTDLNHRSSDSASSSGAVDFQ